MTILPSATQSAVQGIQRGLQDLNQAANKVAEGTINASESGFTPITEGLIEAKQAEIGVRASAASIRAYDDALGSLLDERV